MNVITNDAYLAAQKRRATLIQWMGLGLVLLSVALSIIVPTTQGTGAPSATSLALLLITYPAMLVGFPVWSWGRGASRRWTQVAKTNAQVTESLKGLNTKYTLLHNVALDKTVLDHLLISPDGLLVMEMKEGGGLISCESSDKGDRWRVKLGMLDRLARLGEEPLHNPTQEVDDKITALRTWLVGQGVQRDPLPAAGVVIFRDPATGLDIRGSKYDVLRLAELKGFVLEGPPDTKRIVLLPTEERNRIVAALRALLPVAVPPPPKRGPAPVKRET